MVRPSVNAKPFTDPIANRNSTTADSSDTASEMTMVPRALTQPELSADLRLRPSRISSRIRSK